MSTIDTAAPADEDTGEYVSFDDMVGRFYQRPATVSVRADFAARTDRGKVRDGNEDHFLVCRRRRGREVLLTSLPPGSLPEVEDDAYTFAVADGLGGRNFGELASFLALRTGWLLGGNERKWAVRIDDREVDELQRKGEVFFRMLHQTLQLAAREDPRKAGMGTTLTLAYTTGPDLFVVHAGDSRAYLLRRGSLRRLTRDHTMAQLLVESGMAEPGSDLAQRTRRVLVNCLGGNDMGVDVDFRHVPLEEGDRVLLCTDGLTDMLPDDQIAHLLTANPEPDAACQALLDAALDTGGKDNITLVVGQFHVASLKSPAPDVGLTQILPRLDPGAINARSDVDLRP